MPIQESNPLILLILLGYFLTIVALGIYYSRRSKSTEDFILAGHSLTTPFVTGSVVATWLGGAVILGGATEAFVGGFQAIVWDPWSPFLTLLIVGFLFVGVFRRSRFTTSVDFYNARYSKGIGLTSMAVGMIAYISWISAQLLSLGIIISIVTGVDTMIATLMGSALILGVALIGGLWALSRSDMLAFIILSLVLLIILPYSLNAVGGITAFVENAGAVDGAPPFSLFYTNELNTNGQSHGFAGYLGLLGVLYMLAAWFSVAIGDIGGSVLTARALAAKDEVAATRGFIYGGFIYLALGMIPVIVGMCAFILYPNLPEGEIDNIFPIFVQNHMPNWVVILFFVAVSSAIVSTAGDTILTAGALIGYTAFSVVKPQSTDAQRLKITRLSMILITIISLLFGLVMGDLYRLLVFAGAVSFPVLSATAICGILWSRANVFGAWLSIITGASSWLLFIWLLLPIVDYEIWDAIYIGAVPAFICSLTAMVLGSLITQQTNPPNPIRDVDGNDISNHRLFTWRVQ